MKKILIFTLAFALVLGNGFMMFEGVVASAENVTSTGSAISLNNDVYVDITAELSLTCDTQTDVDLGDINGMTGGIGTGATVCNVSTNDTDGYNLTLAADSAGLVNGAYSIPPISDGAFSVAASASGIGYNASSSDPADTFWFGLSAATDVIATTSDETAFSGDTTTINYRVEVGNAKNQEIGRYDTTVTYTATAH